VEILNQIFKSPSSFYDGLAYEWMEDAGKYGFIDKSGNIVITPVYDCIGVFRNGYATGGKTDADGNIIYKCVIDKTGREILIWEYDWWPYFNEGLSAACIGVDNDLLKSEKQMEDKWVTLWAFKILYEMKNPEIPYKEAYPEQFEEYERVNSREYRQMRKAEHRRAYKDSKWGYVDITGKIAIDFEYDYCEYGHYSYYGFHEGLSRAYKNGRHGYIDRTGKIIVPIEYDYVQEVREGLAAVEKDGKWGILEIIAEE